MWYVSTTDIQWNSLQQLTHRLQFSHGDVLSKREIYKGRGYRVYSARSFAKARAVKIKLYEGSCAKEVGIKKVFDNSINLTFSFFDSSVAWQLQNLVRK